MSKEQQAAPLQLAAGQAWYLRHDTGVDRLAGLAMVALARALQAESAALPDGPRPW